MYCSGVRRTREFARKSSAACRVCTWQAIFPSDREPTSCRLFIELKEVGLSQSFEVGGLIVGEGK